MRLPSAALIAVLTVLAGCASATAPDLATRVIVTDDLNADLILGEAATCGYPGVHKTLGKAAESTVTIPLPIAADARYLCLTSAMTARTADPRGRASEGTSPPKP